jgi:hypothetical protein
MNTKVATLAALISSMLLSNSGGGLTNKSATRYSNATGGDAAGANICS